MQIGIDVGATKIESVVLDEKGNESHRERTDCPKDYFQIIKTIKEINKKLEKELKKESEKIQKMLLEIANFISLRLVPKQLFIKEWLDLKFYQNFTKT